MNLLLLSLVHPGRSHGRERVLLHAGPRAAAARCVEQRVGARGGVGVSAEWRGGWRHPAPTRQPRSHGLMHGRRGGRRRGVTRDGPGGELTLPSFLRRELTPLLQLLRGAHRRTPAQDVPGSPAHGRVFILVEEIGVIRPRRWGPWLAAARARPLHAVERVGAHGADGLARLCGLARGSARELARPGWIREGGGRERPRQLSDRFLIGVPSRRDLRTRLVSGIRCRFADGRGGGDPSHACRDADGPSG